MNINEDEKIRLIKALKTIRETCRTYDCYECPLGGEEKDCRLDEIGDPEAWEIKDEDDLGTIWRAYK